MTRSLLIDGQWCSTAAGARIGLLDPANGQALEEIARGTADDIIAAVAAARRALAGAWGRLSARERGEVLCRWAARVDARSQELARIESLDTGKPISTALRDIGVVARYLAFYGAAADKLPGEVLPYASGYDARVVREPLGVTGHIIPWNYPASQFARTAAPALAMGNAAVVKPSEYACLSVLQIADLGLEAGLPPGSLNIVTGTGEEAGAALSAHPDVDHVSFTGSPRAGALVQKAAADNHVPCSLELGGKSPHLVFADCDLNAALEAIVRGIVQHAGQTCSAGSRVLVERSAYKPVIERIGAAFTGLRAGDPDMDLDCGPLISDLQLARVGKAVETAMRDGIRVVGRGRIAEDVDPRGYWFEPVAFADVPPAHPLAQQEVFGPVLAVLPFDSEEEAVALANGTPYGLVAALWTADGDRQQRLARQLNCGQVFINCFGGPSGVELPFGGVRRSGHGREKGMVALHHFSRTKTIVQRFREYA